MWQKPASCSTRWTNGKMSARPTRNLDIRRTAGQTPFAAGSRIATHSTCDVIGNVQFGPLQTTCRSEAGFQPIPGHAKDFVRHTCVTAAYVRQRRRDHDHDPGHSVLGSSATRRWLRESQTPRPKVRRQRGANAGNPLPGRRQAGGVGKEQGVQTQRVAAGESAAALGSSIASPLHMRARWPPPSERCLDLADRGSPAVTSLSQQSASSLHL
jgi:hypothetical protein